MERLFKPRFALSTISVAVLVAFAIGFTVGLFSARRINPCVVVPTISVRTDTVLQTDTVAGEVPPPIIRRIIVRDTLVLPSKTDTTKKQRDTTRSDAQRGPQIEVLPDGRVKIPIEQKVYATALYRAVVSGWSPSLDSMEVYATTKTVTNTVTQTVVEKPPRHNWSLSVGPAATYTVNKEFIPGVSATLGFIIKSW